MNDSIPWHERTIAYYWVIKSNEQTSRNVYNIRYGARGTYIRACYAGTALIKGARVTTTTIA